MLATPDTPPRATFSDRTNVARNNTFAAPFLPTPPKSDVKKRTGNENFGPNKRVKLTKTVFVQNSAEGEDEEDEGPPIQRVVGRRHGGTVYDAMRALAKGDYMSARRNPLPSRPILQTFVSSNKSDVFKCQTLDTTTYFTPPYACAFSHASKQGRSSLLAIATEQGSVEILNTARRHDWDAEPPRTMLPVHSNGVFDVRWSTDDALLATVSGDHTACITDVAAQATTRVLRGHASTVKCVAWDPNHRDLLSTAGRDGRIYLWDLREHTNGENTLAPVLGIRWAHEPHAGKPVKKGKTVCTARSVTSLLYLPHSPYEIVSSGSTDGIVRKWDIRFPVTTATPRSKKPLHNIPIDACSVDPTALYEARRARGICSLALGTGPSEAMLFALGNDSKVHTYNAGGAAGVPLQADQGHGPHSTYTHPRMATNSFYVKIGVSPCGRWLASGGADGSAFLFDVGARRRPGDGFGEGLELKGQTGEVGALDWADGQLATCADDGTVRVWRPDMEIYRGCVDDPEESRWNWSWAV